MSEIYINGIQALTGKYLVEPLDLARAAELIKGVPTDSSIVAYLRRVWRTISQPHLGLPPDVDPAKVNQAGWGIVFHKDEDDAVKAALNPLLEHRRQQCGSGERVKILEYSTGDNRAQWLARYGVGAGSVDPTRVPYYLLLVGGPERIPFTFCHQLDVEYAVGCLHFDSVDDYRRYAESVVRYETAAHIERRRDIVFFCTRHTMDQATQLSADYLVKPLASNPPTLFRSKLIPGTEATKAVLSDVLDGTSARPSVLFTATHGVGWPADDADQTRLQGALLCKDWPPFTPTLPAHYFSASDLPATAKIHGVITFHFACYGGGTPLEDRFLHKAGERPPRIAQKPFIAALPKALLAHPEGGALACVGHVERAWGYSIVTSQAGPQLMPFQNFLIRLSKGEPVGHAMKDFNERYASLSTTVSSMLEQVGFGGSVSYQQLASAWIERNDAEGYLVVGDPAVALRVADMD